MNDIRALQIVQEECKRFPQQFKSLILGTVNASGRPEASYAPYVEKDGVYYVYVSELSAHTANLAGAARSSILFIEDENNAKHIFARQRLTLDCTAAEIARSHERFQEVMDIFRLQFGSFMDMLSNLQDFHLFALTPEEGGYVAGFAKAYRLTGTQLSEIQHRNDQGHSKSVPTTRTPHASAH